MPCNPTQPQPSAFERLTLIADALLELTAADAPAVIVRVYGDYLKAYLDVMAGSLDAASYQPGLIMLTHYTVDEDALASGETTLANLRHVVSQSLQMIP